MIDKLLALPKIDSSASAGIQSRVDEAIKKVASTAIGGGITSIASGAPTLVQMAAANMLGRAVSPILGKISGAVGSALSTANGLISSFSSFAGADKLLSGLPSNLTAGGLRETVGEPMDAAADSSHKVKLMSQVDGSEVVFDNMPEVNEVRAIEYEALSPPHMPGEFQKYRGTKSTQWTLTVVLTAATVNEATLNRYYVNTLRAWSMPYFGEAQSYSNRLGAPPPVLSFSGWRGLVGTLPVVLTSMNWTWPKDVDWLPTSDIDPQSGMKIPFPAVITLQMNLVEALSAAQFNAFDLASFRAGDMIGAYSAPISSGEGAIDEPSLGGGLSIGASGLGFAAAGGLGLQMPSLPSLPSLPSGISSGLSSVASAPTILSSNFSSVPGLSTGGTSVLASYAPAANTNISTMPGLGSIPGQSSNLATYLSDAPISGVNTGVSGAATSSLSSGLLSTASNIAGSASLKLNQSIYFGTSSAELTYTGSDALVWDRVNSERMRRGLSGLPNPRPN